MGLYHYAILLPDRPALGRFLRHLSELDERAGMSDHFVSEALYLTDPDGLGIEVYADRPRSAWRYEDRQLTMTTIPLDVEALLHAAGGERWSGMPSGTVLGHVHLFVADLERAAAFYHAGLGLDKTVWSYPGALFMSADAVFADLVLNIVRIDVETIVLKSLAKERERRYQEESRRLLARQLLLERSSLSIPEAVETVGGLQTQYAPSGYVGLWTRLAGFQRDELTAALVDRSVIQATLLRTTIHVVSRREYWPYALGVREARREQWRRTWARAAGAGEDDLIAAAPRPMASATASSRGKAASPPASTPRSIAARDRATANRVEIQ